MGKLKNSTKTKIIYETERPHDAKVWLAQEVLIQDC